MPEADAPARPEWQSYAALSCLLFAAGIVALGVDVPVAQATYFSQNLRNLHRPLQSFEPIGEALGVLLIAVAVHRLDVRRPRAWRQIVLAGWGAGLLANLFKLLAARARPYVFQTGPVPDILGTFAGEASLTLGTRYQSFPSAHTATAVAAALALGWLYPRARGLYFLMAAGVAFQRIETGAHWTSDTILGAAAGVLFLTAILLPGPLRRRWDAWGMRAAEDRGNDAPV